MILVSTLMTYKVVFLTLHNECSEGFLREIQIGIFKYKFSSYLKGINSNGFSMHETYMWHT